MSFIRTGGLFALMVTLILVGGSAQARVVAILFDDSGSMAQKIQLPAFAAQLLVASLDGRGGRDRLVTARMNLAGALRTIELQDIGTLDAQRELIDRIATDWPRPDGGTPYEQLPRLLEAIRELQQPGEEAFLIVLTDGAFEPEPNASASAQQFSELLATLPGPLRVEYVLIGPDQPSTLDAALTVGEVVKRQGIRDVLLGTFNRDPGRGRHDVADALGLTEAIRDIVASTSSTNRADLERFLERGPKDIRIRSPLSIRRVVTIATAEMGATLERPDTAALSPRETYALTSRMLEPDRAEAWANTRLQGEATHLLFDPPLSAGDHDLLFDNDVRDTLVLIETEAELETYFTDATGVRIDPDADGVVTLVEGADARVAVEIIDAVDGQKTRVPIGAFGEDATVTVDDTAGGAQRELIVNTDAGTGAVFAPLPTAGQRTGRISAALSVRGLETASPPKAYRIVPSDAQMTVRLIPAAGCADCDGKTLDKALTGTGADSLAGYAEITALAPIAGTINVSITGDDGIVSLSDTAAVTELSLQLRAGEPLSQSVPVYLTKPADNILRSGKHVFAVTARAVATAPLSGGSEAAGTLRLSALEAELIATGTTRDRGQTGPLVLDIQTLKRGDVGLVFEVRNALADPKSGTVEVLNAGYLRFEPEFDGPVLRLTTRTSAICSCLLAFDQTERTIRVQWRDGSGLQAAEAKVEVRVAIPFLWQGAIACGRHFLLLISVLYVLRGLIFAVRTRVFPRGSGIDIADREGDPRFHQFPSGLPTRLIAFLLPFGNRDQQHRVAGLRLQAASNGALVLFSDSEPSYVFEYVGQPISAMVEVNPKQKNYRMSWDESATSGAGGRRVLRLLRRAADRIKGRGRSHR